MPISGLGCIFAYVMFWVFGGLLWLAIGLAIGAEWIGRKAAAIFFGKGETHEDR